VSTQKPLTILAIESSCDETACAIVQKFPNEEFARVISETTATSLFLHKATKGIVPEVAAREQLKAIMPVLKETMEAVVKSQSSTVSNLPLTTSRLPLALDAIAVTVGPGLVGSLLVGIETARALAYAWDLPIIPVNHLKAHPYANFVSYDPIDSTKNLQPTTYYLQPKFPLLSWVISGGHTELYYMESHEKITRLGGTVDDAAGECFDKCARVLGYDYPGGPVIDTLAQQVSSKAQPIILPRPLISSGDFRLSFSGLKTAFLREHERLVILKSPNLSQSMALELQKAVSEVIVQKTRLALKNYPDTRTVIFSGGVSANSYIRKNVLDLKLEYKLLDIHFPSLSYCTDNAVMIGAYAVHHPKEKRTWKDVTLQLHDH